MQRLNLYKNPIFLNVDDPFASLSAAETAINNVLSSNAGYCLVGFDTMNGSTYVFDEDWGVPNPIHSVVLYEVTGDPLTQIFDAFSANPGYGFVEMRIINFTVGDPVNALVLGKA